MSETGSAEGLKGSISIYFRALHELAAHIYRRVWFVRMAYEQIMAPRTLPQPIRRVLFVCKANICRSPLAEGYFMDKARKEGLTITAKSAGIETQPGRPAHMLAKEIARKHGFSLDSHVAIPLFNDLIKQSDLVLVMEIAQKDRLMKLYPKDRHKVFVLGQFCNRGSLDIDDPYQGTREDFLACFERIRESCDRVMQQLGEQGLSRMVTAESK